MLERPWLKAGALDTEHHQNLQDRINWEEEIVPREVLQQNQILLFVAFCSLPDFTATQYQ